MTSTQNGQNGHAKSARLARFVIRWRWPVLLASLVVAMAAGMGGSKLAFNNDYHVFFGDDNPQLKAFDALQEKYTKDDNVFIVIEPQDGEVFTNKTLAAIEELTAEAWQTPFSSRVDAITNFQYTKAVEDDLYVDDLVEDAASKTPAELQEIKKIATEEPLLVNRLVDEAGTITAINITVKLPGEDMTENTQVVTFIRDLVADFQETYPHLKTYESGMVMLSNSFQESAQTDMSSLIPMMFLVIVIAILLLTRSVSATFATLVVIVFSIMTAMGLAGWFGMFLTPPSSAAPTIITTLAVADSIHILVSMLQLMRGGMSKREALVESMRLNFLPVFITSVTTIIGFLTLNFSDTPPFHDLGNITAMGMAGAFIFSVTALPALMAILPVRVKVRKKEGQQYVDSPMLNSLAGFVTRNYKPMLWGSAIAIIGISLLSLRNELNDEFVEYFSERVKFRTDTDYISQKLTGIYNVEFSIGAGESGGVNNPEYLEKLDEFEGWLYEQPEVIHVNTFSEVARRINKSMHGDSLEYYRVPDNREAAAQFLLLYEMSLPFGLDLNNQVNVDKSETRFTVTTENISSEEMIAFTTRSEKWLEDNAPAYMFANGSGTTTMFSHLTKRQIQSMMRGTVSAIILISLILAFALNSFKYGLISLLPNVLPISVGFGVWAILVGQINAGVAIVFGMTLGIIVDDTVHFLSKYLRARREQGLSAKEAVRYAFNTVGKALVVTTIVLVLGFMILAQSNFGMNSGMAKITVLIITLALIIDFLMLPALLITLSGKQKDKAVAQPVTVKT